MLKFYWCDAFSKCWSIHYGSLLKITVFGRPEQLSKPKFTWWQTWVFRDFFFASIFFSWFFLISRSFFNHTIFCDFFSKFFEFDYYFFKNWVPFYDLGDIFCFTYGLYLFILTVDAFGWCNYDFLHYSIIHNGIFHLYFGVSQLCTVCT